MNHQERTEKQKAAHERNFKIFYFRGVHKMCALLWDKHPEMEKIMQAIDDLFVSLGADTQDAHDEKARERLERKYRV